MGFTFCDHFQPGSKRPRPTFLPATFTTLASPLPSNGRVSSGQSKLLTSTDAITASSRRGNRADPTLRASLTQGPAGGAGTVEQAAAGAAELDRRAPRPQHQPDAAHAASAAEEQPPVAPLQRVPRRATGARHQLRDPVSAAQ